MSRCVQLVSTGEITSARDFLSEIYKEFDITFGLEDCPLSEQAILDYENGRVYHCKKDLDIATDQLNELKQHTATEWYDIVRPHLGHEQLLASRCDVESVKESCRLTEMLAKIDRWKPSSDHQKIKELAKRRISEKCKSIHNRHKYVVARYESAESFYKEAIEDAERTARDAEEELDKAVRRRDDHLEYFRDFIKSLEGLDKQA